MNQFHGNPLEQDFGREFNYAVWTADTHLTLTNVPWNNDYRDIVKFTQAELDAYIDGKVTTNTRISNASYAPVTQPILLDIPFNKAYKYNYIRAHNGAQPITPTDTPGTFYYFIVDVQYIAPNTTQFVVQLDMWQTFGRLATFGNCYIERGHIGIANENQFQNFGRDYLAIPEGIDTGGEYRVIATRREDIANMDLDTSNPDLPVLNALFDVLVVSTVNLSADPGTEKTPKLTSANGPGLQSMMSGASFYVFSGATNSFSAWLTAMQDKPWVTQGIVSITTIPRITRYQPGFMYNASGTPTKLAYGLGFFPKGYAMFPGWRDNSAIVNSIPARYRHLKKFFTFPYMAIELTTWYGSPIVLKPESWADPNASVLERVSLTPPNQRISFHPRRYNANNVSTTIEDLYPDLEPYSWYGGNDGDDQGDYLDIATYISSFPNSALVNDGAIGFLAANTHGIAFQNDSANWSHQRALRGNEVAYDQASRGIALTNELAVNSRNQDALQTSLNNRTLEGQAWAGAVGGVATGAGMGMIGGPAGAAVGGLGAMASGAMRGVHTGIQMGANMEANGIRMAANAQAAGSQTGAAGYMRDTNKNLADWAAKGDYENQIAGINAKVQDSRLIQPSTSGQFGGDSMNFNNNTVELNARWKLIDNAAIRVVGEYWLRYGYAVRQFGKMPASLMVMSKFTYWKLSETYITSADMPEPIKQGLRGMFEKGVTVWKNPADIGNIDIADNVPLEGITL